MGSLTRARAAVARPRHQPPATTLATVVAALALTDIFLTVRRERRDRAAQADFEAGWLARRMERARQQGWHDPVPRETQGRVPMGWRNLN